MDAGYRVCLVRDFRFLEIFLPAWSEGVVTGPNPDLSGCVNVKFDALGEHATPLAVETTSLRVAEGGRPSRGQ